jgi:hypothetical protein
VRENAKNKPGITAETIRVSWPGELLISADSTAAPLFFGFLPRSTLVLCLAVMNLSLLSNA